MNMVDQAKTNPPDTVFTKIKNTTEDFVVSRAKFVGNTLSWVI